MKVEAGDTRDPIRLRLIDNNREVWSSFADCWCFWWPSGIADRVFITTQQIVCGVSILMQGELLA